MLNCSAPEITEIVTITPNTRPKKAPSSGPKRIAPIIIGMSESVGEKVPKCIPDAKVWRTIIRETRIARTKSFFVFD